MVVLDSPAASHVRRLIVEVGAADQGYSIVRRLRVAASAGHDLRHFHRWQVADRAQLLRALGVRTRRAPSLHLVLREVLTLSDERLVVWRHFTRVLIVPILIIERIVVRLVQV